MTHPQSSSASLPSPDGPETVRSVGLEARPTETVSAEYQAPVRLRRWVRRLVTRHEEPHLTGEFVSRDADGVWRCAGCGPWCKDHGWKPPEPTGNPEADLAAAKAYHARVNAYLDGPR